MMQGDQYRLPIELVHDDGSELTPDEVSDIEVLVGGIRKTYKGGDVYYEDADGVYYIDLTQHETFMFRGKVDVKVRVKFLSGDVVGLGLGALEVEPSASKVVL